MTAFSDSSQLAQSKDNIRGNWAAVSSVSYSAPRTAYLDQFSGFYPDLYSGNETGI